MPKRKHKFRCEVETCRKALRCWFPASMEHAACRSGHGGEQHIGQRIGRRNDDTGRREREVV